MRSNGGRRRNQAMEWAWKGGALGSGGRTRTIPVGDVCTKTSRMNPRDFFSRMKRGCSGLGYLEGLFVEVLLQLVGTCRCLEVSEDLFNLSFFHLR